MCVFFVPGIICIVVFFFINKIDNEEFMEVFKRIEVKTNKNEIHPYIPQPSIRCSMVTNIV